MATAASIPQPSRTTVLGSGTALVSVMINRSIAVMELAAHLVRAST